MTWQAGMQGDSNRSVAVAVPESATVEFILQESAIEIPDDESISLIIVQRRLA